DADTNQFTPPDDTNGDVEAEGLHSGNWPGLSAEPEIWEFAPAGSECNRLQPPKIVVPISDEELAARRSPLHTRREQTWQRELYGVRKQLNQGTPMPPQATFIQSFLNLPGTKSTINCDIPLDKALQYACA
ncbi:hypothetical protein FRB94_014376, partial [Tulasnella sp. JGI-2019a]